MLVQSGIEGWLEADGDNTLALDWDLNESSIVMEIGGFEGRWAQQMWDKFHCYILVYEPQLWAAEKMMKRFAGNKKIIVYPYGLSVSGEANFQMTNYETDGCSLVQPQREDQKSSYGLFVHPLTELYRAGHKNIDVCLMNIEGYEYHLIPYLIHSNMMSIFRNFWCQFHPTDDRDRRADEIKVNMGLTHDLLWNYYPTAVAWRRK